MDVSIIMPVYNVEAYIEEALDSLLSQSYCMENVELIIVNDGSTDNSMNIINKKVKEFKSNNIIIINKKNEGASVARNIGLRQAKGKYIYFFDSDDKMHKDLISNCIKELEKNNLELLTFDGVNFYDGIDERNLRVEEYDRNEVLEETILTGEEFLNKYYLSGGYKVSVCIHIYRREFLLRNNLNFIERVCCEDENFTIKAILLSKRMKYINKKLFYRRIRNNSMTTKAIDNFKIESIKKVLKANVEFISSNKFNEKENIYRCIADRYDALLNLAIINIDNKKVFYIILDYIRFTYHIDEENKLLRSLIFIKINNFIEKYMDTKVYEFLLSNKIDLRMIIDEIQQYILKEKKNKAKMLIEKSNNEFIAIYGSGMIANNLIQILLESEGFSIDRLVLIDSFIDSNNKEKILGVPIINVKDVNKYNINVLVIGSLSAQKVMITNFKAAYKCINAPHIYTLNDDIIKIFA